MGTATKNLEDDHVHILRLIEIIELIVRTEAADIEKIEEIVEIIRNFADGIHHAKEEQLFFPYISDKGFPPNQGPVAVMLHEHILGREFVKSISDNISKYSNGNIDSLGEIFNNMNGYAVLLKNHISKENNILFRMADRVLSESDHRKLLESFGEAEKTLSLDKGPVDYIRKIDSLEAFYKI